MISQAMRTASITVETADDIDMTDVEDAEENIHAKGMFFNWLHVAQQCTQW
jgi:membrane-bound lytic murein transglycosylase MltF